MVQMTNIRLDWSKNDIYKMKDWIIMMYFHLWFGLTIFSFIKDSTIFHNGAWKTFVSLCSKNQHVIALSSCEEEYIVSSLQDLRSFVAWNTT
ncbi:hypothetical protein CR513_60874, partial [Mucuna pruriens]